MDAVFYLCGPSAFATTLTSALGGHGRGSPRASAPRASARRRRPERRSPASARRVRRGPERPLHAQRSVGTLERRYSSLLELAEACDVPVRWSCRTGVCHNCECAVVGGELKYVIEPWTAPGRTHAAVLRGPEVRRRARTLAERRLRCPFRSTKSLSPDGPRPRRDGRLRRHTPKSLPEAKSCQSRTMTLAWRPTCSRSRRRSRRSATRSRRTWRS